MDLLVSLAYVAAVEGTMDDPLPVGLGLQVPHPGTLAAGAYLPAPPRHLGATTPAAPAPVSTANGTELGEIVEFDTLNKAEVSASYPRSNSY